jgi:uncharacterized protein YraI
MYIISPLPRSDKREAPKLAAPVLTPLEFQRAGVVEIQCASTRIATSDASRTNETLASSMLSDILICRFATSMLLLAVATTALAQGVRRETVELDKVNELHIAEGTIAGHEIVDYQVSGERSQILSVDLMTSNRANYFNILPASSNQPLFIGSTRGTVADVALPESGTYVIRVYLMRSAARRGETAKYSLGISLGRPEYADGLSGGPDYWMVSAGGGYALNLRLGPSTRYEPFGKLRNGEVLQNRGCRLTGGERWCEIRAMHTGVTGWVAGRYLVESAAPRRPAVVEGGPTGNGLLFDATGVVSCAARADQPVRQCPFGVVREGPGNAGLWVALGDGIERHIVFEGGMPVATNLADTLSFEKAGDLLLIRVRDERFEVPESVVTGG